MPSGTSATVTIKASYKHFRPHPSGKLKRYRKSLSDWKPLPRGGATLCTVSIGGEIIAKGATFCSDTDQFCYKDGRVKAKNQAFMILALEELDRLDNLNTGENK